MSRLWRGWHTLKKHTIATPLGPQGRLPHSCPPIYVQGDGKGQALWEPRPKQHRQAAAPPSRSTVQCTLRGSMLSKSV